MGKTKGPGRGRRATEPPPLRVIISEVPDPDYERLRDEAIDALCEALADRLIRKARAKVAAELGIEPSAIPGPPEDLPTVEEVLDDPRPRPRRGRKPE